jgi:hypothetical protein
MGFLYQGWVWPTRSMLLAHLQISDTGPKPNTRTHISAHPPRCPLPVPFATIIEEQKGLGAGTVLAALMTIIFSLVAAFAYLSATTIFEQTLALLI